MKKCILPLAVSLIFVGCQKEDPVSSNNNYDFTTTLSELSGSTWVITRYDVSTNATLFYPDDTLYFLTDTTYHINNLPVRSYHLYQTPSRTFLSLYNCSSLGGSFRGQLSVTEVQDGFIYNTQFDELFVGGNNSITVWMERL